MFREDVKLCDSVGWFCMPRSTWNAGCLALDCLSLKLWPRFGRRKLIGFADPDPDRSWERQAARGKSLLETNETEIQWLPWKKS